MSANDTRCCPNGDIAEFPDVKCSLLSRWFHPFSSDSSKVGTVTDVPVCLKNEIDLFRLLIDEIKHRILSVRILRVAHDRSQLGAYFLQGSTNVVSIAGTGQLPLSQSRSSLEGLLTPHPRIP